MYKKILVPLDGSKLAECVLPHVESLATCSPGVEVMLVSVTERVTGFRVVDDSSQLLGERLMPEAVGKEEGKPENTWTGWPKRWRLRELRC